MAGVDPYNDEVRRRFSNPVFGGALEAGDNAAITARHDRTGAELSITLQNNVIEKAAYRVRGCPHLVAALELTCEALLGKRSQTLADHQSAELMRILEIPREKRGKILVIEDLIGMLGTMLTTKE